ncbi:MAG TPA: phosphomannomutase/phosphoglucomutase [archaeon]|nr:phosphomannomutase/phosphoglucomutase [archaeon]
MNKEIFREYDIRGIAQRDIDNNTALLIGKAYATMISRQGGSRIVVGNDNRDSGPRILKSLLDGILSTGINVTYIGEIPTPMLYYAVYKLGCDGGISVTASHNPPEFNGFKVMVGKDAIYGKKIEEIYKIANEGKFAVGKNPGSIEEKNLENQYIDEIASIVRPKKKLKIVVDAGNGMASEIAPKLLKKLGCKLVCLYCEKISSYPNHLPDPVQEKNVADLKARVKKEKADMGIAFDGDSDRIGVVDEKGNLIYGDRLLAIFAQDALLRHPGGKVIFEVKCSQALEDHVKKSGGIPIMWKTGHSLIKAKMKEEGALIAGEMSGHMFFTEKWYGFDDAFLAAARIVEIVANSTGKISELDGKIARYYSSPEYRVDFDDREKFGFVKKATEHFSKKYKIIDVDGCRVVFENGWALVRASNTQSKLIIRMEGKTQKDLEAIKGIFLGEIEKFSGKKFKLEE